MIWKRKNESVKHKIAHLKKKPNPIFGNSEKTKAAVCLVAPSKARNSLKNMVKKMAKKKDANHINKFVYIISI